MKKLTENQVKQYFSAITSAEARMVGLQGYDRLLIVRELEKAHEEIGGRKALVDFFADFLKIGTPSHTWTGSKIVSQKEENLVSIHEARYGIHVGLGSQSQEGISATDLLNATIAAFMES